MIQSCFFLIVEINKISYIHFKFENLKKHLINLIKFLISLSIGICLIYWSQRNLNETQKHQVINAFNIAKYKWLYLLIFFGFISNFSRTQRWILLLRSINYNPRYSVTFFSVTIMFFANIIFPRLGEVSRCAILSKYEDVPIDKSLGTMVLERIIDLFSILLIGLFLIFFERNRLSIIFNEMYSVLKTKIESSLSINNIILGLLVTLIFFLIFRQFLIKSKFSNSLKEKIKGVLLGLISIKNLEQKWQFLFHSIFIWMCYISMQYFGFKCLEETAHLGIFAAMACLFFGGFAMVLTQGGIGAYPIAIQHVLSLYLINDIVSLSYGWISWSAQTVSVIIGGVLSLIFLSMKIKKAI